MYRGFNLDISKAEFPKESYEAGLQLHSEQKKMVEETLDGFLTDNGELNASKMQANWFPQISCDVFISHSHKDENLAISLAGWLKDSFEIVSFIDSCAWGYSDHLLRLIDDQYCYNEKSDTYIYQKRNRSTSHVHMMLSTALSMMIDNAECVLFLNTPTSITPDEVIGDSAGITKSPWIYSEIAMTRLIRKKSADEHRGVIKKSMAEALIERMEFLYNVKLDHLAELNIDDLNTWQKNRHLHDYALDALYAIK